MQKPRNTQSVELRESNTDTPMQTSLDGHCPRCGERVTGWTLLVDGVEHMVHPCNGALVIVYDNHDSFGETTCPICEHLEEQDADHLELVHTHRVELQLWSSDQTPRASGGPHDAT